MSGKGAAILAAVAVGATVLAAVLMHNAYESNKPKMPTSATMPQMP
jgi:hypothetical protein